MQTQNDALATQPVGKRLFRLAVPAITAQLVNALYNIVDRIYIGHIPEGGDMALTGLGICFPVLMFVSAISALVGMGGGSRAVVRMGEGRTDTANEILGNCTALLLVLSAVVMVLFQLIKEPMLMAFGASANTIGYAMEYLDIYLWGTVFVEISLGLNFFITTQGFSGMSMVTVLIGAITNIILDPIFIFAFDMGVRGAALATIIAQGVSAVWVLVFLTGKKTKLRLQTRYIRLSPSILVPVLTIGVSPFIMQATESLVNVSFNSSLYRYGSDAAVGAIAIGSSVMQVFCMLFQGLAQGAQPIIGFNFGAGNLDRVKKTFRLLLIFAMIFSCSAWAAVQLFPGFFVSLFNDEPGLASISVWSLRIYLGCLFMLGIQFSCQQTFVALGEAKASLFLALLRKIFLLIPLIFILPQFFEDKLFAVFVAEPIADFLAATTTGLIFLWRFPRILREREREGTQERE